MKCNIKFKNMISNITINTANNQFVISLRKKQLKKMDINTPKQLMDYLFPNPKIKNEK